VLTMQDSEPGGDVSYVREKLAESLELDPTNLEMEPGEWVNGAWSFPWHMAPSSPLPAIPYANLVKLDYWSLEHALSPTKKTKVDLEVEDDSPAVFGLTCPNLENCAQDFSFVQFAESSITAATPRDFQFRELRQLETELLQKDIECGHVLAPFRARRLKIRGPWTKERCEQLTRSVFSPQGRRFPPLCEILLRETEAKQRRQKVRLATTAMFADRLKLSRPGSRCQSAGAPQNLKLDRELVAPVSPRPMKRGQQLLPKSRCVY